MIDRLENAGLGYHVDANQTIDKLGTSYQKLVTNYNFRSHFYQLKNGF